MIADWGVCRLLLVSPPPRPMERGVLLGGGNGEGNGVRRRAPGDGWTAAAGDG